MHACEAGHDLLHPGVEPPGLAVDRLQEFDLVRVRQPGDRIDRRIKCVSPSRRRDLYSTAVTTARDRGGCVRRLHQRRQDEIVRIRETGLFPRHRANANTLIEVIATLFDDAVLERPGLVPDHLKIKVGIVDPSPHQRAERLVEMRIIEPRRLQQRSSRDRDRVGIRH